MENEFNIENEKLQQTMDDFMHYLTMARNNGELDLFASLFQTDYRIMTYLANHTDAHPSEMADELRVTRPNIAANLRLLEQKDYIVRVIDEDNRRQVYVNMTEEGRKYLERCSIQLKFLFAGWFSILGEEETNHLINILKVSTDPTYMTENLKNIKFGE